ncbi:MAG: single-stranded-DNA-specific exonuclease RecJ [Verrucomicrobiae bacterium]|nr:single-stranded-DNA-specific exonuclease RecJ [Verrucomicrobiae bacterium]
MARWVLKECDMSPQIAEESGLPAALAGILWQRGFRDAAAISAFLDPKLRDLSDPFLLPDMEQAVAVVETAIRAGERIVVFGDYDVDGVTSSVLLTLFFRSMGAEIQPFLPHRMDEGYGMSREAVERCHRETTPGLLIAVDCGTNSVEEIRWLRDQGARVIVLDHHEVSIPLPVDYPLVNPKRTGYLDTLASVGLCFKFVHAYLKVHRDKLPVGMDPAECLRELLGLTAIGTVADLVPLTGENRLMVRAGMARLEQKRSVGLNELFRVAGITYPLTPHQIGFQIGPRLNAAGRLESAMAGTELLLCQDPVRAGELAGYLDETNRERQDIERKIAEEAVEMARTLVAEGGDHIIVLSGEGWHIGVVGIVASRVLREFNRPVVVIGFDSKGQGKGSCRSIGGFNILSMLEQAAPCLEKFGGHAMAAGISIEAGRIPEFRERVNEYGRRHLTPSDLEPVLIADVELDPGEVDENFMEALARMQPFGQGHPDPLFWGRRITQASPAGLVGRGHLKLRLAGPRGVLDGILFGWGSRPVPQGAVDILYSPEWNEFRGRRTIQLKIRDLRES